MGGHPNQERNSQMFYDWWCGMPIKRIATRYQMTPGRAAELIRVERRQMEVLQRSADNFEPEFLLGHAARYGGLSDAQFRIIGWFSVVHGTDRSDMLNQRSVAVTAFLKLMRQDPDLRDFLHSRPSWQRHAPALIAFHEYLLEPVA